MNLSIGIDIGGSNIKAALFDLDAGRCLERLTTPTRDGEQAGDAPAWAAAARDIRDRFEAAAGGATLPVGISAPGLAAADESRIAFMPGRMEGLAGFDWPRFLKRLTRVINDAHAALLGEIWQGAARGLDDVILLTLGTGVGGAVVSGGRLLRGHFGRAGHLGHISLDPHGTPDIVNTPGSLEDSVGNATVTRRTAGRFTMTRDLLAAAEKNDPDARNLWDETTRALAAGIVSLINCFDPQCVILGGGIASGAGPRLLDPLEQWLDRFEWRPAGHRVSIRLATLGEWAGAHGAAWHAVHPEPAR